MLLEFNKGTQFIESSYLYRKQFSLTRDEQGFWLLLFYQQDRQCYSRVLELLVNVWAYHSARRMVYVNPETGAMEEQHKLKSRRGQMWIKFFSLSTLKTMDEDLAEEFDSYNQSRKRWLWPHTGEVFWHGTIEKERKRRLSLKDKKKQETKDKIKRIKSRAQQKPLGKYIKSIPKLYADNSTNKYTTIGI